MTETESLLQKIAELDKQVGIMQAKFESMEKRQQEATVNARWVLGFVIPTFIVMLLSGLKTYFLGGK